MENAIVLYPCPAMGHLFSMVELGKLILNHYPCYSIHILITTAPYSVGSTAPYIQHVSATTPSINFHHLPTVPLPPQTGSSNFEIIIFEHLRLNNPNVHQALLSISQKTSSKISALVVDVFCTPALSVAADLKVPAYYFFTSNVSALASLLYLPTIHQNTTESFKDLINTHLDIPGLPPMPTTDMPKPLHDRANKAYEYLMDVCTHLPKSRGIIVNTFELLEPRAFKAISDGLCVPDEPMAPIYCVGPLIAAPGPSPTGGVDECLMWLDSQPYRSVVFLSFGSMGVFSAQQLREIAVGLERSGQRFLWVVRSPPSIDQTWSSMALPTEPDLESLLPYGFLVRTKERGLVVKSWAPQVAVLNHNSVGGFVTHCGWNSVLEAVCAGVPMVAWPLYAEQKFNRVLLVEEMKLALPTHESEDGFVSAAEVEKRVCELMDSDEGNALRKEILTMKGAAKVAMAKVGSSRLALNKLVDSWNQDDEPRE